MERWLGSLQRLREVVRTEDVRMSGAWAAKPQLRYASPTEYGTGEGPYVKTVDWRWEGVFESASPVAGIAFLSVGQQLYWAKSQPAVARPEVTLIAHGWAARPGPVRVGGSFHGSGPPSVTVEFNEEPPVACIMGASATSTGTLHVVARSEGFAFAVLLLPASAIKVGRNRLWRLREDIGSRLPADQCRLLRGGRFGNLIMDERS